MKNFKLNLTGLHGSPNQTGETLTRENRLGIVTCLNPMRTLLITLLLLTLGVGQMWGESVTFYVAVGENHTHWDNACRTFYSNVKRGNNDWEQIELTRTDYTYNGKTVYQGTHNFSYGGYNNWQFYIKDGSSNNQKYLEWYAGEWETDLHNGEVWDWTGTETADKSEDHWKTATWDDSYTVYFARTSNWDYGAPYFYGWNGNCDNNSWPGTQMNEVSGKTFNGKKIYTLTVNKRYANCKFSNNGSNATGNFNLYGTNDGKMYYWDGSADQWVTLQYDVTLDRQNGTTGSTSIVATCGSTMPSATMPTRDGYTFAGYYTGTSGSGTKYYNADGSSAATWPSDGTGPTTLYAYWTQDPGVATLTAAGNATELWIGVNPSAALTFTATSSNVSSGTSVTWSAADNSDDGIFNVTSSSYSGATITYTPGSVGAKTITVTMTIGGNNYTKTYNLTVYERWNIYVRDEVDSWGTMYLYLYNNSTSTSKTAWPGDACSSYKSSAKWYTVTLDSKYPHFILNNNNANKQLLGDGSIEVNKVTYPANSYWKTAWDSDGTGINDGKKFYKLTSATITDPIVAITRCDVYSTYALLEGQVTGFGGDGSALSDLKEYGFYVGETKHTTIQSTSGTRFHVKVKSLTPGNTYNIKAFATNIDNTAYSDIQSKTASNASRTIGVRYPDATDQTLKLYAYRDIPADYGTETVKNAEWSGVTLTRRAGTSRWWETTLTNAADYESFIVSNNGESQANAQAMPATDKCYWYNPGVDGDKIGIMDCPYTTPQLYINATAGATDYAYNEMSTSPSISKTMSLSAGTYTFKIMYNAEWYGKNSDNTISRTGATTSNAVSGVTIDQDYITLTADFAGDYIFTFDPSTNTVTVTYPTAYVVTYSKSIVGTDNSTTAAPSAAYTTGATAVTSGDLVLDGTDVTFTAAAAGTGYTWKGWYTVANPSADYTANRVATTAEYPTTISAATTIYAVYAEDMHTVTVTAGEHGSITTPASGTPRTVQAGIATSAAINTTNADYGYVFKNWTVTSGESTDVTFVSSTAASTTITATANATVQANFISHWTVVGGDSETTDGEDAMGNWNEYANAIDHFTQNAEKQYVGYAEISLPANTTFYVKIRDLHNTNWYGNTGEMTYTNNEGWTMESGVSTNCRITTAGAGNYIFTWNENTRKLTVTYPDSYTVTYGKVADNGQDIGGVTAIGDDDAALVSGKYVAKGSATFTAADAANYTFIAWRTGDTYGEGTQLSTENPYTMTSIAENKTVYAHYAENMTTVNLSATNGKIQYWDGDSWEDAASSVNVGVVTNCSIKAVPATGYYFSGWVNTEGSDYEITGSFNVEDNNNTTLKGKGVGETTGQTLTANFVALGKIYFDNSYLSGDDAWDDVYVYFGATWAAAGDNSGAQTSSNAAYAVHMTQIGTTGIYEAVIPRAFSTSGNRNIAFATGEHGVNYKLHNEKGVYRTDWYYSATPADNGYLNIYRPSATPNQTTNNTKYYSIGYWAHYDAVVGQGMKYYLHRTSGSNIDFEFKASADKSFVSADTIRIDHTDAKVYYIGNSAGQNYYPTADITTENSTVTLSTTNSGYTFTPTSEGVYTFYLNQEADQMVLTVDYPAAVGDYRLVYTNTAMGSVIRTTDIIKNRNKANSVTTMFIDKDATGAVLKLQKCTAITDRKPVWSDAGGTGATTLLTAFADKEADVYKFTIVITDDAAGNVATSATCEIDEIEKYKGPFYIKTDCANGGWASFTANEMEENTVNYDGTDNTYNYYYCKWVDGITESFKMNMKFVIATDYNNAVSDTISETPEEDFLVSNGSKKELLPENANVRFSFNTKTGTAKRAYILGSTALETFIWLQPNAAKNVYNYVKGGDGGTDMYYVADGQRKFKDNGNWTYQMDVELTPNAKAGVKVRYPSSSETPTYLVPQTTELIGSSNAGRYDFRLVYDFKTNHLIAAWIAGEISETLTLDANVMMIREAQDASKTNVIILNNNHTIQNTDTAYGAIEFKRDAMVGQLNTMEKIYEQCLYYISFPFDVKVSDVIGIGKRGVDWNLYKYNGTKRAEVGWFLGDGHETFWETMSGDDVMHAYEGYCLGLEETHFNDGANAVWTNISAGGSTFIYFPSSDKIGNIENDTKTITVPDHICEIDQYYKQDQENYPNNPEKWRNHKITDSNWNVIGSPLFANGVLKSYVVKTEVDTERQLKYYYAWDHTTGNWSPLTNNADWMITEHGTEMTDNEQTFNAMFGYFVQFAGTVTFEGAMQEEPVVARRKAAPQNYAMSLELSRGSKKENRAFVELREGANDDFMLDEDMCLMASSNADIYTYAGAYDAMANVLSMDDHTVRVGVDIKTAGEYTFSMPVMFDGTAVLVDLLTGTRTNLALSDYTVSLNKGMYNDRFVLEIGARKIVTSLDTTDLKDGNVHKFVENGVMYILRDGKRYDAQGKVVNN